jgi:hypothetical protein
VKEIEKDGKCKMSFVTPYVIERLIKLIKLQLSPNARLNQDTKVWNQIQKQRLRFQVLFSVD